MTQDHQNATTALAFCGIRLTSPLILASGILGLTASSLKRVAEHGAGAVTTKSFGIEPRTGHKNPSIIPFPHGLLNAVGLSNPGMHVMAEEIREYKLGCPIPIIASVFGRTIEEFAVVAETASTAEPDCIELNVSCPNVSSEFGTPFGASIKDTAAIVQKVRNRIGAMPLAVKLTVNCPSLQAMAQACQDNGADIITAVNTVGPGMLIDYRTRKPVLSNKTGGISGPAMFPIAVRAVFEIFPAVSIPIIGTGGVTSAEDAMQLIMAGATAVGIGSGIYYGGIEVLRRVNEDLTTLLDEIGYKSLDDVRGVAHE